MISSSTTSAVSRWLCGSKFPSGLKLTAFLGGARAFIEQTAPGMTNWESLDYHGQPYVKITPTERALPPGPDGQAIDAHLFYVASGKFLLLTPSEAVLKRALDRQVALETAKKDAAKKDAAKKDATVKTKTQPWLGTNLGLQVDHKLLPLLMNLRHRVLPAVDASSGVEQSADFERVASALSRRRIRWTCTSGSGTPG